MASFTSDSRLRRTRSDRSFRPPIPTLPPDLADPDLRRYHAATAAARAMQRSSERSSTDSRGSYDRLGGPGNVAVPQRRLPHSIRQSDGASSFDRAFVASTSPSRVTPRPYSSNQENRPLEPDLLASISENQEFVGRLSPQPSSYRRLRKARSMFSTKQRAPNAEHGSFAGSDGSFSGDQACPEVPRPAKRYGTLRRSMSFLRGGNQPPRALRHAKSQNAAIEMARDQFTRNSMEEQDGQHRHASLGALNTQREPKPFRKTFRTVSAPLAPQDISSSTGRPKTGGIHEVARTFSVSVKKGIKRVLGLAKTGGSQAHGPGSSPSHSSWRNRTSSSQATETDHPDSGGSGPETFHDPYAAFNRVLELRSGPSSESLSTMNSRVTSWTNSTAANTIATRRGARPLSIIQEHGEHVHHLYPENPSPLIVRPGVLRKDGSVDSEKVYAALVDRISRDSRQNPQGRVRLGSVGERRPVTERAPSALSQHTRQTIRQVPSDESMGSSRSFATASWNTPGGRSQTSTLPRLQEHRETAYTPGQHLFPRGENLPGPERTTVHTHQQTEVEISVRAEASTTPPGGLGEHANNDAREYSPSIYSRSSGGTKLGAEADRNDLESEDDEEAELKSTDYSINSLEESSTNEDPFSLTQVSKFLAESEDQQDSNQSDDGGLEPNEEPGTATIIESQRAPYSSPRRVAGYLSGANSSQPSADWGRWMSRQWVSGDQSRIEDLTPTRDHYRENTQINHDEDVYPIRPTVRRSPGIAKRVEEIEAASRQSDASLRTPTQASFSRPFQPSSARTVVCPQGNRPSTQVSSSTALPMQSRHSNMSRIPPESPTPRRDASDAEARRRYMEQYRRNPVLPTLTLDVSQFRSLRAGRENRRLNNENVRTQEGGGMNPDPNKQPRSRKELVETFLSRPRPTRESEVYEDGPAFI